MKNQTPSLTNALCLFVTIFLFAACKPGNSEPKIDLQSDTIPSVAAADNFISLSDVHLDSDAGNIYYAHQQHADTGDSLWHRTKLEIEAQVKKKDPKFMVYLGDLPTHHDATRIKNVGQMLKNLRNLKVGVPILYLPGNNDALMGDYNSFSQIVVNAGDTSYINAFSRDPNSSNPWPILNHTTPNCTVTDVDFNNQFGFYSCALNTNSSSSKLHIIALNTVIFVRRGSYHTYTSNDGTNQQAAADIQLKWLIGKLEALAASNDRVMIMMHIPPGYDGFRGEAMWDDQIYFVSKGDTMTVQTAFLKAVHKHKKHITSILTGHTHLDGLRRLLYPNDSTMVALAISTPGITPGHGNNPGFKFFKYDSSNFDLLDFETHYAVPTRTMGNHHHHNGTYKYQGGTYTFSQAYGTHGGSMFEAIKNMDRSTVLNNMKQILKVQNGYYGSFDASALDAQQMTWQKNNN